jgi:molybdopterin adenylyltransferase
MSHLEHQQASESLAVGFAVLTLSDTRTRETDTSGKLIRELMIGQGHNLVAEQIIKDEPLQLSTVLESWLVEPRVEIIVTNGGTGLSRRDQTIDVIEKRLDRVIPGFGEIFRMLSYREIGAAAMLSRAVAGVANGKVIFSLPGSTNAVRLAMNDLILPQVRHVARELRK